MAATLDGMPQVTSSQALKTEGNDAGINTIRGVAILLVIAYHVIGHGVQDGLRLDAAHPLRQASSFFDFIRMPLFTMLSGWVFANRPSVGTGLPAFYATKLRRLWVPALVVAYVYLLVRFLAPAGSLNTELNVRWWEVPGAFLKPFMHLWFLQALFTIFLLIAPIEKAGILHKPRNYVVFFLIAIVVGQFRSSMPDWMSCNPAAYLLPFFVAGYGIRRYPDAWRSSLASAFVIGLLIARYALLKYSSGAFGKWVEDGSSLVATLPGIAVCSQLISWRRPSPQLAWVGQCAFTIYLYHMVSVGVFRFVLPKFGIHNEYALCFALVILGAAAPIALHFLAATNNLTRVLILGVRPAPSLTKVKVQRKHMSIRLRPLGGPSSESSKEEVASKT